MKCAICVEMDVGILPGKQMPIRLLILLIQTRGEGLEGRLAVRDCCQVGALEIGVVVGLPGRLRNQVVIS